MSKYFCPIPFVNIEARTNGDISPCCQYDGSILGPDGEKLNLNKDTLSLAWDSQWLADFRKQFISGERPIPCNRCWEEEDAGIKSKRLRSLEEFNDIVGDLIENKIPQKPLSMDLKLGNICNNKCRICSSYASSQWISEEKARDGHGVGVWKSMKKLGRWTEQNNLFWKDLDNFGSDVQLLEFYGGEPFIINEHYDVLETLVNQGRSKDIILHYNTNGTVVPPRGLELWPHFKKVLISFSIDGTGTQFEYIRHPAKWDNVFNNLNLLLEKNIPNLFINICHTVSIFNIYYLDEFFLWRDLELPNISIYVNYLTIPNYLSCKILPDAIKYKIKEKFETNLNKLSNQSKQFLTETINYCLDGTYNEKSIDMFYVKTSFSDSYRDEKFSNIFPEYYRLLKRYTNCPINF